MTYSKVTVYPEKCTGCRACEMVCSLNKWGECSPERAAIRNIRTEAAGLVSTLPVLCQQCENPICQAVCPVGAITRDELTGALVVDEDKCLGCRRCVYSCPFGGVSVDSVTGKAVKCDLCGGDPNCVKFCSKEALQFVMDDKISANRKRQSSEKYREFLKGQG